MNFKDSFISKKSIKKVVDPSSPEYGLFDSEKTSPITIEVIDTPSQVIIQDILDSTDQVQQEINFTLSSIYNENKGNEVFKRYYDLIQSNYWDPYTLMTNSQSKPQISKQSEIKLLERSVYRTCDDPRAGFVQDLYNFKSDCGGIKYIVDSVWREISNSNSLYNEIDDNNLFKFGLNKRKDRVELIRLQNERISNNTLDIISSTLIRALINKIFIRGINSTSELNNALDGILSTLKQFRSVIYTCLIVSNLDWEHFSDVLKNMYQNLYNDVIVERITSEAYSILSGIQNNVENVVLDLESALDVDGVLSSLETDIPEIKEFENMINQFFVSNYAKIEQDLVKTKSKMLESEEVSRLKVNNSRKASKWKQLLKTFDTSIAFIESMRSNISDASFENLMETKAQLLKLLI